MHAKSHTITSILTWYYVIVELRLRKCYQAMQLEMTTEDDWLHTDVGRDKDIQLGEWRHRLMSLCIRNVSKFE